MTRGAPDALPIPLDTLDLARWLRSGDYLVWGQGAAEPVGLVRAVLAQAGTLVDLRAFVGMTLSPSLALSTPPPIRLESFCGTGANQALAANGWLDLWPGAYSMLPRYLAERVEVLLLGVSSPDANGGMSLGLAHEYLLPLIDRARVVIAEVNPNVPFTCGARTIRAEECTALVEGIALPPELTPRTPSEAEGRIAARVAALIEDGSTLQTGIGSLPDAILAALGSHRDLGLHSGMAAEGCMALFEAGALTNARKNFDTGVSVAGMALGSAQFYRFLHENRHFSFRGTAETHDSNRIAALERFVAINSALEVDLSGQINAESVGGRYLGAVGGAGDFLRGAARSPGGLPIIVLPATSKRGEQSESRIVARLNGPVSTARTDAGLIITEYGVADLRGKTLRERRAAMLAIAAPEFRVALDAAPLI